MALLYHLKTSSCENLTNMRVSTREQTKNLCGPKPRKYGTIKLIMLTDAEEPQVTVSIDSTTMKDAMSAGPLRCLAVVMFLTQVGLGQLAAVLCGTPGPVMMIAIKAYGYRETVSLAAIVTLTLLVSILHREWKVVSGIIYSAYMTMLCLATINTVAWYLSFYFGMCAAAGFTLAVVAARMPSKKIVK